MLHLTYFQAQGIIRYHSNWLKFTTYIPNSKSIGSIYILCPKGTFVRCNPKKRSRYSHISKNFSGFHQSSFQKKSPNVLKNFFKFQRKRHMTSLRGLSHMCFRKNSAKDSEKFLRRTPISNCFCAFVSVSDASKYSVYISFTYSTGWVT